MINKQKLSYKIWEEQIPISKNLLNYLKKSDLKKLNFISKGDDLIVEAKVHLVFINERGKPIKIPETLYKKFKPYFCDSIKT